jgi:hypothetical protein
MISVALGYAAVYAVCAFPFVYYLDAVSRTAFLAVNGGAILGHGSGGIVLSRAA